jgi:DeoR/GlpR family transcriptional regulator of sugar metabolism
MKRTLASRAAETYVLGSDEKMGTASRYTVLPLDAITGIITDRSKNDPTSRQLTKSGATLVHTS